MATSRDTFPLRFSRPETKEALKQLAASQGMSMTALVERAVEHEIALLGADMERRLAEALDVVRSYRSAAPESKDRWVEAVAEGESSRLDPMRDVVIALPDRASGSDAGDDPFGVLAAFARG